jgi:hypothetical protein
VFKQDAFVFKLNAGGKAAPNWPRNPGSLPGLLTIDLPIDGVSSNDNVAQIALDGPSVVIGVTTLRRYPDYKQWGFPPSVVRIHAR